MHNYFELQNEESEEDDDSDEDNAQEGSEEMPDNEEMEDALDMEEVKQELNELQEEEQQIVTESPLIGVKRERDPTEPLSKIDRRKQKRYAYL